VNNCYMRHYSRVFKPTEVQMMLAAFLLAAFSARA
jgi:ribonucleoside-diphosphate reductase beta chain